MSRVVGVTGLGSLPGVDFEQAVRRVFDDCPDQPYLPELPARGPWAGIVGRGAALLAGLPTSLDAGQWRLTPTAGVDHRRAVATLRDDCDRLEEFAAGWSGPLRVACAGPVTLAASLFRPLGGRVLADRGARRDVAQALAEGVREFLDGLRRRVPGATWTLQVDEPSLPAALAGAVPTEGGYFRHRALSLADAVDLLRAVTAAAEAAGVTTDLHCCAPGAPIPALLGAGGDRAGFGGISLDAPTLGRPEWDTVAAAVEAGHRLLLGVVPSGTVPSVDEVLNRTLPQLRALELGDALADRLVLTPACGLAGVAPDVPGRVFVTLRRVAGQLDEELRR